MGVELSGAEVDALLASAHTGVLVTLRADGWPVPLPMWFVHIDGTVFLRTPAASRKVARIRADERVAFLVERGEHWGELTAVVITGRAAVVDDTALADRVSEAFDAKYAAFRPDGARLPRATTRHYGIDFAVVRLDPVGTAITWDNSKIRLTPPSGIPGPERPSERK